MKVISEPEFESHFTRELIRASFHIREDVRKAFKELRDTYLSSEKEWEIVNIFLENAKLSEKENRALCQDTGYIQVYIDIGNEVQIPFNLKEKIETIVSRVYSDSYLRKSLAHSILRLNTQTNTPVFINYDFQMGNSLITRILIKGGGSENATKSGCLLPTTSQDELIEWIVNAVLSVGAKACPPYLIGVGIGGTLEKAVSISKRLLLEPIDKAYQDSLENILSEKCLNLINSKGVGFQGLSFGKTALSVKIKSIPCHIATLPIAVSIGCNAVRQSEFIM